MNSNDEAALRAYLNKHLNYDMFEYWGKHSPQWVRYAEDRHWDISHQQFRVADLLKYGFRPGTSSVLDVGAGCGQFVHLALTEGYYCMGIEPSEWRLHVASEKTRLLGKEEWAEKVILGVGESLPFADNTFDACTTYQTLEHVKEPSKVLEEMIRVTRVGGGLCIRCPDYRSTFEAHYQLSWLPLFPKKMAKIYLKLLKKPLFGLDSLQYITKPRILKWLTKIEQEKGCRLTIIDDTLNYFENGLRRHNIPYVSGMYSAWRFLQALRKLGRIELEVNLFVRVLSK
jgi:ubiquinone/menaquinone biosynthesis C-methylase UbiE